LWEDQNVVRVGKERLSRRRGYGRYLSFGVRTDAPVITYARAYKLLIGCTNKDYFKASQLKQLSCQILWEVREHDLQGKRLLLPHQKAI
jgi:hypothetical protein